MKSGKFFYNLIILVVAIFINITIFATTTNTPVDPLPSWNDGPNKQSIINFVKSVTDKKSQQFTPIAERIATIDNDGTLWTEQPLYPQGIFAVDRIKTLAPQHPEWQTQEPFKTILATAPTDIGSLATQDFQTILATTHSNMPVDTLFKLQQDWLATARQPRFNRLYTELVYQPMLELMNYLRDNNFKVYIVSGSGQEFIRAFSEKIYGVPTEQVIGTATKTQYTYENGKATLMKLPEILIYNDKAGKAQAINLFIGRHPLMAFGNSDGDREMLEWTQANGKPHFMGLIHHDDAQREYAYGSDSKVGRFSDNLMKEAKDSHWTVVSMKNDWKMIFPTDHR